jgi:hypothetical protein
LFSCISASPALAHILPYCGLSVPADFEYECAWQGLASLKFNRWITRAELLEKGFRKFVVEFDQRLAANALGNDARPLSKETITKFLCDFGLEPEFGVHSNIRGLSGVWVWSYLRDLYSIFACMELASFEFEAWEVGSMIACLVQSLLGRVFEG